MDDELGVALQLQNRRESNRNTTKRERNTIQQFHDIEFYLLLILSVLC